METLRARPIFDVPRVLFPLPTVEGYLFIPINHIVRAVGEGAYSRIHLLDGKEHLLSKSIGWVHRELEPEGFLRVHRSHTVNQWHIARYFKGGALLILRDHTEIPLSNGYRENFLNWVKFRWARAG